MLEGGVLGKAATSEGRLGKKDHHTCEPKIKKLGEPSQTNLGVIPAGKNIPSRRQKQNGTISTTKARARPSEKDNTKRMTKQAGQRRATPTQTKDQARRGPAKLPKQSDENDPKQKRT